MEQQPVQYPCVIVQSADAEDVLATVVKVWLREQVELRAPRITFRQSYDRTRDQQYFDYLRGADQRCILPDDANQQAGEYRSAGANLFTKEAYTYLYDALEQGLFRPGLAALLPSFCRLMVPLGRVWLALTPAAPVQALVVDERRKLLDVAQCVAVLRPASSHLVGSDDESADVVPCLPSQCDLALWWQDAMQQRDEGHAKRTLALCYGNTRLMIEVDESVSLLLPQQPQYFALRPCAILSRLMK